MPGSDDSSDWAYRERMYQDLRRGAVAGLLGGGSVMLLVLGSDTLFFKPLATPDFLAKALIGDQAPGLDFAVQVRVFRIVLFTALHLAVFTGLGILFTALLHATGARESLLVGGLYGLSACTTVFAAVLHLSGTGLLAGPNWPTVLLANFVAGVVMVSYLKVRAALDG
jgi:hypothetical protein